MFFKDRSEWRTDCGGEGGHRDVSEEATAVVLLGHVGELDQRGAVEVGSRGQTLDPLVLKVEPTGFADGQREVKEGS